MNTTVAIILCAVLGFVVSALLGIVLVPWLHKLKFGQTILDIGPSWHKKKQGTPTMGGIMFIIATIAALLAVTLTDYFRRASRAGGRPEWRKREHKALGRHPDGAWLCHHRLCG